jgi:hypothetical protein
MNQPVETLINTPASKEKKVSNPRLWFEYFFGT